MVDSTCSSRQTLKLLQGVALALCCVTEVPTFVYSGRLLRRVGTGALTSLILLMWSARFAYYSLMSHPWHILPVELMGGVIQALAYSVLATVASDVATDGTKVTMVSLAYCVMDVFGYCVGGNVAGLIYDYHGGSVMFGFFSVFVFAAFLFNMWLHSGTKKSDRTVIASPMEKRRLII